ELQEAERLKIEVPKAEVDGGFNELEHQNHMPKGALIGFLESKGVDPQSLRDQVEAQLAWSRVVRQQLLPTVRIGEGEVDARLQQMKEGINKPSYLAADIYLAVEDPQRDHDVRDLATKLVEQLRAGAPFQSLARQFSQSGAATGGDLGWVSQGMLDDTLLVEL